MSFSNAPLVLPWPLKIGLELATRALLDPGDQSSVDFSRPAGEPALVSPDSQRCDPPPRRRHRAFQWKPISVVDLALARRNNPRPVQHGGGVALVPVLHSIRTASAWRLSRLRRSPLRGEILCRSALSAASNARRSTGATVSGRDRLASPSGRLQPSHP
jgi:hypothetical protein